jgi:hypothetical protein
MLIRGILVGYWQESGPASDRPAEQVSDIYIKNGAGEGIRTLDPNLGKVVLYP